MNISIGKIIVRNKLVLNDVLLDRIRSLSIALDATLQFNEIVRYPSGKGFVTCSVVPNEYRNQSFHYFYILDLLSGEEARYEDDNNIVILDHKEFHVIKKERIPKCPHCGEVI